MACSLEHRTSLALLNPAWLPICLARSFRSFPEASEQLLLSSLWHGSPPNSGATVIWGQTPNSEVFRPIQRMRFHSAPEVFRSASARCTLLYLHCLTNR